MRWKRGDAGRGVRFIQEWLCLRSVGVLIDRRFGPATEHAVKLFQGSHGLPVSGVVDDATWNALITPQRDATAPVDINASRFGDVVVACAECHLGANAREVGEVFPTIEGNSSDDLQTNSYEVCRRIRSYEFETKEFIDVE